ncbi:tRNA (guanosine(46)-N7)-methyltransferase TrmB [Tomitella cavernea]|uniref:tRNA (guanine-N(7)-)-methyltransferase n=1 Tax=Tomitella cavernea TaxID=1387982 RepID=A0ABP9D1Z7_9ACTN
MEIPQDPTHSTVPSADHADDPGAEVDRTGAPGAPLWRPTDEDTDGAAGVERDQFGRSRLHPRVTSFRTRRGTLTEAQLRTWDETWSTLGRDVRDEVIDTGEWFGRSAPVVLEIGCGTGTSTAEMALAEPGVDVLAVEVYRPGLAQLLHRIKREGISNVRLLRGDGVDVMENMIAPASLTGVRVFFPDPWPKKRHHKRRLLQPAAFSLIASRLRPGGVLHVATDHADYAEWITEAGATEPMLRTLDSTAPISLERPVTKFEGKGLRAGSTITEMIWRRVDS